MREGRGFTLTEAAVALMLVTTLLGIALPRASGSLERKHLDNVVNQFIADFYWAQSLAVANSTAYTLQVIPSAHQYRVRRGFASPVKVVRYDERLLFNSNFDDYGYHTVLFNAAGHVSSGGTFWVTSHRGERVDLVVQLTTGRIEARWP